MVLRVRRAGNNKSIFGGSAKSRHSVFRFYRFFHMINECAGRNTARHENCLCEYVGGQSLIWNWISKQANNAGAHLQVGRFVVIELYDDPRWPWVTIELKYPDCVMPQNKTTNRIYTKKIRTSWPFIHSLVRSFIIIVVIKARERCEWKCACNYSPERWRRRLLYFCVNNKRTHNHTCTSITHHRGDHLLLYISNLRLYRLNGFHWIYQLLRLSAWWKWTP